jgi:hypothetical protein
VAYEIICFALFPIESRFLFVPGVNLISPGAQWADETYHVMAAFDVDWLGVQPDNTASLMMAIDQGNLRRKQKNSDGNSNEN